MCRVPYNSGEGFRSAVRLRNADDTVEVGYASNSSGGHSWVNVKEKGQMVLMSDHPGVWWLTALGLAEVENKRYLGEKARERAAEAALRDAIIQRH